MDENQIKYSLWLAKHRVQLFLAGKIALIILAVLPWIFFVIYLTTYLLNIEKTNNLLTELGLIKVTTQEISKPSNLVIVNTSAFESSTGVYDVVAEIKNPNSQFASPQFTYSFSLGSLTTDPQTSYLLPGETKYLVVKNLKSATSLAQAKLNIYDLKWKRIVDPSILPQTNFIISETGYSLTNLTDVQSQVTGKIYNQSAYGFEDVEVTAILLFNNNPVAVHNTSISRFLSGQEKTFNFTWPKKYPLKSEVKIQTQTNILNDQNLILP